MTIRPLAAAAVIPALIAVALLLSACAPGTPEPTRSPSATPTTTATPTPTPTAAPPVASGPSCESIVPASVISAFAADGITITPAAEFNAKLAAEGNALTAFFTGDGVACQTGQAQGASEIYAYAPLTVAQFAPLQAQLLADGYAEQVTDAGVLYRVPDGMEGLPRVCYHRPNAFTVCGNDDDRLGQIIDTLGLG